MGHSAKQIASDPFFILIKRHLNISSRPHGSKLLTYPYDMSEVCENDRYPIKDNMLATRSHHQRKLTAYCYIWNLSKLLSSLQWQIQVAKHLSFKSLQGIWSYLLRKTELGPGGLLTIDVPVNCEPIQNTKNKKWCSSMDTHFKVFCFFNIGYFTFIVKVLLIFAKTLKQKKYFHLPSLKSAIE